MPVAKVVSYKPCWT